MNELIALIRKLLGLELTIAKITSPITKIVDKLDAHSGRQAEVSRKAAEAAKASQAHSEAALADSKEAAKLAQTYSGFFGRKAA